jgi:hypothetical protein
MAMGILAMSAVAVVLELFTSEGCSSCPPADRFLQTLIDTQPVAGVQIIALGEHVDYWDRLGWKDRFSSASVTARQQAYGARFNNDAIYTPQMVVDGRVEFVGTDANAARKAIERARDAAHGTVRIDLAEGRASTAAAGAGRDTVSVTVRVSDLPASAAGERADVVVALTEDGLTSDVKRGENQGRRLSHAAVVRHLAAAGEAASTPVRVEIPLGPDWRRDHLHVVAFVQQRHSRAILAAAATALAAR